MNAIKGGKKMSELAEQFFTSAGQLSTGCQNYSINECKFKVRSSGGSCSPQFNYALICMFLKKRAFFGDKIKTKALCLDASVFMSSFV